MNSFIETHPFPTHAEMLKAINGHPDTQLSMAMWAEYGKPHHAALKAAYESGMDPAVVRKAGETIHSLGGMQAMQMNYYAFSFFSPFQRAKDPEIRYAYKQLEYGWDGVGSWVA
jgi:hypothetical protein